MKKVALITLLCLIISILPTNMTVFAEEDIADTYNVMPEEELLLYLGEALDPETSYSSNISEYDNFLVSYYDNLTYNFGVNYKNSCGYIAAAMLLSYYDTYWDDTIIPEQYDITAIGYETDFISERNSPGVLRDVIVLPDNPDDKTLETLSASDYYSIMESMSNISLHAKLITIGASFGWYNFDDDSAPALTSTSITTLIIRRFLNQTSGMQNDEYSITTRYGASNDVKEHTIRMIQAGYPVMLAIGKPDQDVGHVVIAYDCDPDNQVVYCHWGFGANYTHINPEEYGYTIFKNATIIDFTSEHSHSDNYGVTTITNNVPNTEYYCYDDCRILTYKDLHSYVNHYEPYISTQHKAYCECGEYITQDHNYSYTDITDTHHTATCVCGLNEEPEEHYIHHYARNNSLTHYVYCECGESKLSAHVVSSGSGGILTKKICIFCGEIVDKGLSIITSLQLAHTENGSYIRPDGIIVLVDEDIEAYLNGELIFYNSSENLETE